MGEKHRLGLGACLNRAHVLTTRKGLLSHRPENRSSPYVLLQTRSQERPTISCELTGTAGSPHRSFCPTSPDDFILNTRGEGKQRWPRVFWVSPPGLDRLALPNTQTFHNGAPETFPRLVITALVYGKRVACLRTEGRSNYPATLNTPRFTDMHYYITSMTSSIVMVSFHWQ